MSEDLEEFQHPKFAKLYSRLTETEDARGETAHRVRLLSGLSGRVVEVGPGNGRNFAQYPPEVVEVVGVEPDATFRGLAEEAAKTASVPVRVVAGHADALPVEDGWADAVVFSLVLCSVPDQVRSVAEAARVLKPGGELRVYEHVRSRHAPFGLVQDAIRPVWSWQTGGCRPNRDTEKAIAAAGFTTDGIEDLFVAFGRFVPKSRHIIGRAVRR